MGDRVSISFKSDYGDSGETPAFYSHWDGMELVQGVTEYVKWLDKTITERGGGSLNPIDRKEPDTVLVDFIRWYLNEKKLTLVEGNYYLAADGEVGYNSDNGHFCYDLKKGKFLQGLPSKEVDAFECGKCGKIYKEENEADSCCERE